MQALLVIEVAETSLRFDREDKSRMYAEAGIADHWIVNLFRDPKGGEYKTRLILKAGETVSPLAFADLEIAVSDLIS